MKIYLNKKGMEIWILVLWILAIITLVAIIAWYAFLGDKAGNLINNFFGWS